MRLLPPRRELRDRTPEGPTLVAFVVTPSRRLVEHVELHEAAELLRHNGPVDATQGSDLTCRELRLLQRSDDGVDAQRLVAPEQQVRLLVHPGIPRKLSKIT